MNFNSPYAFLGGYYGYYNENSSYPHQDLSVLDPTLGGDPSLPPLERVRIQRYLEYPEERRFWELYSDDWYENPPMEMIGLPATPTLESNDRSSTPDSLQLPSLPPNSSYPVTQGSLQQYGEPQRPPTPLESTLLTSTPGAFSEEDHPIPQAALMGLSITDDPQEVVGNTIHVQVPNQIPSSRSNLGPNSNTPLPLTEQNTPGKAVETMPPVSLMSPPMQPSSLPTPSFRRPQTAAVTLAKPKNAGKNKSKKQSPRAAGPSKVVKSRQRSTAKGNTKTNTASGLTSAKLTAAIRQLSNKQCKQCEFSCKDSSTLNKHVKLEHGHYSCAFQFAGCHERFATKNEWKRHVNTRHTVCSVYVCSYDQCSHENDDSVRRQPKYIDVRGQQFNRKDLRNSHVIRMHHYPGSNVCSRKAWEAKLNDLLEEAPHQRCSPPTYMECPSPGCGGVTFEGDTAWDQRMEHIARHMEKAASGEEEGIVIGGDNDRTLIEWASSSEAGVLKRVDDQWEVVFPKTKAQAETE
ncbi:unnamed protein product [Clonostachys rosea]|uniref:C2H2-type domain-containing protein n=1 Tax=Bionectria ochroleuca TaxID=29856 RepID=A0ABY6TVF9_BIOOC|nr:unnamed protein product [Clonostachys rosea]